MTVKLVKVTLFQLPAIFIQFTERPQKKRTRLRDFGVKIMLHE